MTTSHMTGPNNGDRPPVMAGSQEEELRELLRVFLAVREGDFAQLGVLFDRHHREIFDFLVRTTTLVERGKVHLIAHSMGNRGLLAAKAEDLDGTIRKLEQG